MKQKFTQITRTIGICLSSDSYQKICVYFKAFCFYISITGRSCLKKSLSTLKVTFHNDHQRLLSNLKDTFYLVHNSDIYYVSHSSIVRFKNKNTFDICKSSKQRKGTNTLPTISVLINKAILGYISTLTLFLLKQSTHINLV